MLGYIFTNTNRVYVSAYTKWVNCLRKTLRINLSTNYASTTPDKVRPSVIPTVNDTNNNNNSLSTTTATCCHCSLTASRRSCSTNLISFWLIDSDIDCSTLVNCASSLSSALVLSKFLPLSICFQGFSEGLELKLLYKSSSKTSDGPSLPLRRWPFLIADLKSGGSLWNIRK